MMKFILVNRNYSSVHSNLVSLLLQTNNNKNRNSIYIIFDYVLLDQLAGLEWLRTLHEVGLNAILADEMGLGEIQKTHNCQLEDRSRSLRLGVSHLLSW